VERRGDVRAFVDALQHRYNDAGILVEFPSAAAIVQLFKDKAEVLDCFGIHLQLLVGLSDVLHQSRQPELSLLEVGAEGAREVLEGVVVPSPQQLAESEVVEPLCPLVRRLDAFVVEEEAVAGTDEVELFPLHAVEVEVGVGHQVAQP
jgi:hypothetical protein